MYVMYVYMHGWMSPFFRRRYNFKIVIDKLMKFIGLTCPISQNVPKDFSKY